MNLIFYHCLLLPGCSDQQSFALVVYVKFTLVPVFVFPLRNSFSAYEPILWEIVLYPPDKGHSFGK